jgi:hypothetical protein
MFGDDEPFWPVRDYPRATVYVDRLFAVNMQLLVWTVEPSWLLVRRDLSKYVCENKARAF